MLGRQTTNFFNVTPNICESSVWHSLHVNPLAPKILKLLPSTWKIWAPLLIKIYILAETQSVPPE